MAITTNNPVTVDGVTYNKFTVNLAVSPLIKEDGIGASVSLLLTKYNDDNGIKLLETQEGRVPQIFYDVFTSGDADAIQATQEIMTSIQNYINKKGL
jgi:hypothetical protein